jgi:hypothetical protein
MTDPKHRVVAAAWLQVAAATIGGLDHAFDPDKDIALAQAQALIALGHAVLAAAQEIREASEL